MLELGGKAGGEAKNSFKKQNFSVPLWIFCLGMGFGDFVYNIIELTQTKKFYFKFLNFVIWHILIKIW